MEKLKTLNMDRPKDIDKIYFYKAEIMVCDGVLAYAKRLSDYAKQLGDQESNPQRRQELYQLSDIMAHVPANPPRTFHEGLQSVWTMESLFNIAENQTSIYIPSIKPTVKPAALRKKKLSSCYAALSSSARKSCGFPAKQRPNILPAISLS